MSLRFAILTALVERDSTGLELTRRFDRSIGYFWPATHQQIYRELDRMRAGDLIREVPTDGKPGRGQPRRFTITADGRRLLRGWISEIEDPDVVRSGVSVRLRAAAALDDPDAARPALEHQRAYRTAMLEQYRAIEQRDFVEVRGDARSTLQHLVLRLGILLEETWLTWLDEALDTIDRLDPTPDSSADRIGTVP
ncbi:PadR family transcriptional regulator [Rhodococcus pyridinivorans]|uniref:PadR family transcriptional regulator n=1 Tax=Rhodococcus pyridinivorans TaxID=103816 RepID=UPI001E3999ED|nr:PadR family transcriptional regulator [Rhodococcus pyridinivorans]UGQ56418.1 PadR family transcriptional regulator [Rhodococcus pyridinivorans]